MAGNLIAENRRARFDYFLEETFEAGIALTGSEVKSLRNGRANIAESYASVEGNEIVLVNADIPPYAQSGPFFNHEPRRHRKLLMKRREIDKLIGAVQREGRTIIPTKLYWSDKGLAKLEISLAKGKQNHDKREATAARDWQRDKARLMRDKGVTAAADVEAIERATVAAVAPPELLEIDGWLVPLDAGTVGRAKSATPLSHEASPAALEAVIDAYRSRGLPPAFRIADGDGLAEVRAGLQARGLTPAKPTWVKTADTLILSGFCEPGVDLLEAPDAAWGEVFLGDGFDPVDGAHRVSVLTRSPDALYGAVREAGATLAVGALSFGHGWAGVHGMRTAVQARGRGYAGRILAAFGGAALARDVRHAVLQVEETNPARSLYRKAGFEAAWRYQYWE